MEQAVSHWKSHSEFKDAQEEFENVIACGVECINNELIMAGLRAFTRLGPEIKAAMDRWEAKKNGIADDPPAVGPTEHQAA